MSHTSYKCLAEIHNNSMTLKLKVWKNQAQSNISMDGIKQDYNVWYREWYYMNIKV